MIASIIVDVATKQVNRSFDYLVPEHLEKIIKVGFRVKVIFGNRMVLGFVIELKNSSTFKKKLKYISDIVDVYPILNQEFIDIAKYIAENNYSYYAVALQTMIPTALKIKYQKVAKIINLTDDIKDIFKERKEIVIDSLSLENQSIIYKAFENKNVIIDTKFKQNRNAKQIEYVYIIDENPTINSIQGKKLYAYLLEINEPVPISVLVEDSGFSKNSIKTLLDKGILGSYKKELIESNPVEDFSYSIKELNESQYNCYKSVDLEKYKTYLLHGVTGSGKTMVYIKLIEDAINKGRDAILLVPEIALTPQMTMIFKGYFKANVEIIHSRLSIKEKYIAWRKIMTHNVKIVIGARSAIFAPFDNLGIIIIDEEHEQSYIQDNNPRYNAIEIAKIRCQRYNCPLVLGSATPNVCDYYKAKNNEYELLEMPIRVNKRPLPKKTIVDMALELKKGNKSVFSTTLSDKLVEVYKRNEQSILFLNRRGHSSFVMCRSCGEVVNCPHCDVSLTYHASTNSLKCHHCGFMKTNVKNCASCGSDKIRFVGSGTEKVLEEINNLLPEARVLRVDLDTTKKTIDYETAFTSFKEHKADILIGTQMIAKGLDFADVTLVGIVNADLALHYPNYLANMTAFNLIEQVSGRAGRGLKNGEVIIQTYKPDNFVITAASNSDYEQFYNKEIKFRKVTNMPPFSNAIEIMVQSKDANKAFTEAKNIIYALSKEAIETEILGPAEGLPFKINDVFRFTIQLKIKDDAVLSKLKEIYPIYQNNKDVDIILRKM